MDTRPHPRSIPAHKIIAFSCLVGLSITALTALYEYQIGPSGNVLAGWPIYYLEWIFREDAGKTHLDDFMAIGFWIDTILFSFIVFIITSLYFRFRTR